MNNHLNKPANLIGKFINVKMGLAGAVVMGLIVWLINMDHGWLPASTAALKQAAYTFLFGGMLIKMLETLSLKIDNRYMAIITATLVTSIVTIILVYIVHDLKGTPETLASTLPTAIMAPPGFFVLAIRKRRKAQV